MTDPCSWCQAPATTLCSMCRRAFYCSQECQKRDWKEGGHKILCKDLKNGIAAAEALIETLHPPPNQMDFFGVVESSKERQAQDLCYDAMEANRLPRKIDYVLQALKVFPLSTEAWRMLGGFFRYDLPSHQRDYEESVRMYDNAIKSSRKLNPSYSDDRRELLEWGHIEARPYLRAIRGRAFALKEHGKMNEAIQQANKLLMWNPYDGIRNHLCSWFLEVGDTNGFLKLYVDQLDKDRNNVTLSYSLVLYQFWRWEKDEVLERVVEKALCAALHGNQYIPDLLLQEETIRDEQMDHVDCGGPKEAHSYALDAQGIWRDNPGALEWLAAKKSSLNEPIPTSEQLLRILQSKIDIRVRCTHTALNGSDGKTSFVHANQRQDTCVGRATPDFYWPRELLNAQDSPEDSILLFRNDLFAEDHPRDSRLCWRKTAQEAIIEVPFWKVLLNGIEEGWVEE